MIKLECPICTAPIDRSGPDFPFCSERCRVVDLGNWAQGAYRVPAETAEFATEGSDQTADMDQLADCAGMTHTAKR